MNPLLRSLVLCVVVAVVGCGQSAPKTSLHQAVQDGNTYLVKKHIAAHSELNKTDTAGLTPLQLAAKNGNLAIVQALTEAGADVNGKGTVGKTPLDLAREQRRTEVVQYFQQRASASPSKGGRGLIDGGLGVSSVLDSQ